MTERDSFFIVNSREEACEHCRKAISDYVFELAEWHKRHPTGKDGGITLDDLPPTKPAGVYLIETGVMMYVEKLYYYNVEWDRFNKRNVERSLLWWIRHLAGRNWFTPKVLKGFIDAVYHHFGIVRETQPELPEKENEHEVHA